MKRAVCLSDWGAVIFFQIAIAGFLVLIQPIFRPPRRHTDNWYANPETVQSVLTIGGVMLVVGLLVGLMFYFESLRLRNKAWFGKRRSDYVPGAQILSVDRDYDTGGYVVGFQVGTGDLETQAVSNDALLKLQVGNYAHLRIHEGVIIDARDQGPISVVDRADDLLVLKKESKRRMFEYADKSRYLFLALVHFGAAYFMKGLILIARTGEVVIHRSRRRTYRYVYYVDRGEDLNFHIVFATVGLLACLALLIYLWAAGWSHENENLAFLEDDGSFEDDHWLTRYVDPVARSRSWRRWF